MGTLSRMIGFGSLIGLPALILLAMFCEGCGPPGTTNATPQPFNIVGEAPSCCQEANQETSQQVSPAANPQGTQEVAQTPSVEGSLKPKEGGRIMKMKLTSPAFEPGQPIPKQYTGEGADVSPPLEWSNVPEGTQEFALICDDPDAPTAEPWVHWVIYKIPADVTKLPEGIAKTPRLSVPPGALQGKNSWPGGQTIGYRGPMPPPGHGRHRYYFRLYALDKKLDLEPGLTKKQLLEAMKGHILGEGELMGTYERR